MSSKLISLKAFSRNHAIRWSLIGIALTLALVVPGSIWLLKTASERHIEAVVRTLTLAFRQTINDGVREAQPQMAEAIKLKEGESVVVRDSNMKAVYNDGNPPPDSTCRPESRICWLDHFSKIEIIEPIYQDLKQEQRPSNYVDLTMKPEFDPALFLIVLGLVLIIFAIQFFGFLSGSNLLSTTIISKLGQWTKHLQKPENKSLEKKSTPPFLELTDMQNAVDGLQDQIKQLEEKARKDAKDSAQLAIIREIGHDLKTPLSQLAKYWAIHLDTVSSTNTVNENEVKNVERILSRMGGIIRQIRAARHLESGTEVPFLCDIFSVTEKIIEDLRVAFDIKPGILKLSCNVSDLGSAFITPTEYYQIIENLIRNSFEALRSKGGKVFVFLGLEEGRPCLTVKDNGTGIPEKHHDKIFDYDFSLKSSKGSGLGLGIVKRICNDYQADLSFKSQESIGTEFKIKFQTFNERELLNAVQSINC